MLNKIVSNKDSINSAKKQQFIELLDRRNQIIEKHNVSIIDQERMERISYNEKGWEGTPKNEISIRNTVIKSNNQIIKSLKKLPVDDMIDILNSRKESLYILRWPLTSLPQNKLRYIHDTLLTKYSYKKTNKEFFGLIVIAYHHHIYGRIQDIEKRNLILNEWCQENEKIASNFLSLEKRFKSSMNIFKQHKLNGSLEYLIEYLFCFYKEDTIKEYLINHSLLEFVNLIASSDLTTNKFHYISRNLSKFIGPPDK